MRMRIDHPATRARLPVGTDTSARPGSGAPASIRIGWVSIIRLMRECMAAVVTRAQPSFDIMSFETASECTKFSVIPFDLIVYHARGAGGTDLQELTELRRAFGAVKLLVLSDSAIMDPAIVRSILADGTTGLILTSSNSLGILISAIHLVSSGGTFASREFFVEGQMSRRMLPRADRPAPQITKRERSVLELIKRGKPNKIIAYELGLSLCTVKVHARSLMRKVGATNRTEAAVKAANIL
jgi:DNA-binding NarL/FixJ family response regulator